MRTKNIGSRSKPDKTDFWDKLAAVNAKIELMDDELKKIHERMLQEITEAEFDFFYAVKWQMFHDIAAEAHAMLLSMDPLTQQQCQKTYDELRLFVEQHRPKLTDMGRA
jgi:hypothetical protein